jgi:hypothetical protein
LDTVFQSQIFTFSVRVCARLLLSTHCVVMPRMQVLAVTFVFSARSELELSRFVFEGEAPSLKHRSGQFPPPYSQTANP